MKVFLIISFLSVIVGGSIFVFNKNKPKPLPPSPPPITINISGKEKIKYPQDHTIVMIGDSMTEKLGNSTELKGFLSELYPGKTFEVLNYGFGSTNILSVVDRITKETMYGRAFRPIEDIDFDLVLLESFAQNPLSQFGVDEGLRLQNQELDKIVALLKSTNPNAKIVFVSTISPNKVIFAKNQVNLTPEVRAQWVAERVEYLKNHIDYANKNNIPVINIFEKSLQKNGGGDPQYISKDDYIHPSPSGVVFISREIANFIYNKNIYAR